MDVGQDSPVLRLQLRSVLMDILLFFGFPGRREPEPIPFLIPMNTVCGVHFPFDWLVTTHGYHLPLRQRDEMDDNAVCASCQLVSCCSLHATMLVALNAFFNVSHGSIAT